MVSLLSANRLAKRYGQVEVIVDVSFDVRSGEILSLIGPNGAGKSTMFNLLTGYAKPDQGEVQFEGVSITGQDTARIAERGIARAFQIARPFRGLTVRDNVRVGALYGKSGPRDIEASISRALELTNMAALADEPASSLTIGQLRRLELARAIACRPVLLLADEPLAGLVPAESEEILDALRAMVAQGVTVMLVEHDMPAVMQISDRIIVLDAGRLIAEGKPAEVSSNPRVIEAYLGHGAES